MKKSQFLSAFLLTACVGVYGSEWQELPSKSENIDKVKLEANHSCLRISSGGRVLGTETICEARHNLVEQMTTLVSRQGGFFTISSVESTFEIDYAPQYCPLSATRGQATKMGRVLFLSGFAGLLSGVQFDFKLSYDEVRPSTQVHSEFRIASRNMGERNK
jgi:hypothetical protein